METAIICALISGAVTLAVCLINSKNQHNNMVEESRSQHDSYVAELEKHEEMNRYRIEQLEKKVEKHNNLVDRTYKLEQKVAVLEVK